jgi:sulfatase modifying factor 1
VSRLLPSATLGVLLALVLTAHGQPGLTVPATSRIAVEDDSLTHGSPKTVMPAIAAVDPVIQLLPAVSIELDETGLIARAAGPSSQPLRLQVRQAGVMGFRTLGVLQPGSSLSLGELDLSKDPVFRLAAPTEGIATRFGPELQYTPDWPSPAVRCEMVDTEMGIRLSLTAEAGVGDSRGLAMVTLQPSGREIQVPLVAGQPVPVVLPLGTRSVKVLTASRRSGRLGSWVQQAELQLPNHVSPYLADLQRIKESIRPLVEEKLPVRIRLEEVTARLALRICWDGLEPGPSTNLERRVGSVGTFQVLATLSDEMCHVDENLLQGTTYEYRLVRLEEGRRLISETVSRSLGIPRPDSLLVEILDDQRARLRWAPQSGIQRFELEEMRVGYDPVTKLAAAGVSEFRILATPEPGDSSLVVEGLNATQQIRWRLYCVVDGKRGVPAYSEPTQTEFPVPRRAGFNDQYPGGRVDLGFALFPDKPELLDGVILERKSLEEWHEVSRKTDLLEMMFVDTLAGDGQGAVYRLVSYNAVNRAISEEFVVRPQAIIETPRFKRVKLIDLGSAMLVWLQPGNREVISGYSIERRTLSDPDFLTVATVPASDTSWVDTTLSAGMDVWYRLRSISGSRTSMETRAEYFKVFSPATRMAVIQGGVGWRGASGPDVLEDEGPAQRIRCSTFELGTHEVSNRDYRLFCESTDHPLPPQPDFIGGNNYLDRFPDAAVVNVNWYDAIAFCNWLSRISRLEPAYEPDGKPIPGSEGFRLPTEAEFEYAVRGEGGAANRVDDLFPQGGVNLYSNQDESSGIILGNQGDWASSADGVYHLLGNAWEWVQDWYHPLYYRDSERRVDPLGPSSGNEKLRKGGGFDTIPEACRVSYRMASRPQLKLADTGFRIARTVAPAGSDVVGISTP